MRAALDLLIAEFQSEWKLSPSERDDYLETLTRRVRNLARIVAQAMIKSPTSPWLQTMLSGLDSEKGTVCSSAPRDPRAAASSSAPRGELLGDAVCVEDQNEDQTAQVHADESSSSGEYIEFDGEGAVRARIGCGRA
jgi:hypothetical protein